MLKQKAVPALLLIAATFVTYQPAWRGGPLWDDANHLTRSELQSLRGLWRIWTEPGATQQYYPLTHSVFWLEWRLWATRTIGYHVVNISLHVTSAILFAMFLSQMNVPGAYLGAALFCLHPVHVESVAWISELKNCQSGALYLGAGLSYLHFDAARRRSFYVLALLLFVAALLSKSVTATFPAALLVVFWWQRGRVEWRRDIVPLVPYFCLSVAAGLFTVWVERFYIGAQGDEFTLTLLERFLIAGRAICFYLGKLFWPVDLNFIYPRWSISSVDWRQYLYPLGVFALLFALFRLRHKSRGLLTGMLFFCGTLFPALGFFNVYPFRYSFVADHFQYLASLGIIALVAAVMARERAMMISCGVTVICVLAFVSWRQCALYADLETLCRATIRRDAACWMMHQNLANLLQEQGRHAEAMKHYRDVIKLRPSIYEPHLGFGKSLLATGRPQDAIFQFQETLRLAPGEAEAHSYWGVALTQVARPEEAIEHYREALRLRPGSSVTHNNWATTLMGMSRVKEAVAHYREALRINPNDAMVRENLHWAEGVLQQGK